MLPATNGTRHLLHAIGKDRIIVDHACQEARPDGTDRWLLTLTALVSSGAVANRAWEKPFTPQSALFERYALHERFAGIKRHVGRHASAFLNKDLSNFNTANPASDL